MNKKFIILMMLLLTLSLLASCQINKEATDETITITEDDTSENPLNEDTDTQEEENKNLAIDFTLENLDGEQVSLSDYKGKKIFLNFWASWCGPCELEMPDFNDFYNEHKDDNFILIAVNVGEDKETVKNYIEENGYDFPVLLDSKKEIGIDYRVSSIPTTFVINEDFEVVTVKIGAMLGDTIDEVYNLINE